MALPTTASTSDDLAKNFDLVNRAIIAARSLCVTWKASCAAGDVAIMDVVHGIWTPFVQEAPYGIWNTVKILNSGALKAYYADKVNKRIEISIVRNATDELVLEDHAFIVGDPVFLKGTGVAPNGLVKGDPYFVVEVDGDDIKVSLTEGGAVIDIGTGDYVGDVFVQLDVAVIHVPLKDAIEAVIDEVKLIIPIDGSNNVLGFRMDKFLTYSTTGLRPMFLTSIVTADLQTKLQDVIDLIEAPV